MCSSDLGWQGGTGRVPSPEEVAVGCGATREGGEEAGGGSGAGLGCADTAQIPRIRGRIRTDTGIRPDTRGYGRDTYRTIFFLKNKENNSDTSGIHPGYVGGIREGPKPSINKKNTLIPSVYIMKHALFLPSTLLASQTIDLGAAATATL